MSILRKYPLTSVCTLLAVGLVGAALVGHVDLIAVNLRFLEGIQRREVDDLIGALALAVAAFAVDRVRVRAAERRQREIQAERLHVLRATMRTVNDIVINALNNFQLVRLEGEGSLTPETLMMLDDVIFDTADKLKRIGALQSTPEKLLGNGPAIDYAGVGAVPRISPALEATLSFEVR